jgi:hypothetical protein
LRRGYRGLRRGSSLPSVLVRNPGGHRM